MTHLRNQVVKRTVSVLGPAFWVLYGYDDGQADALLASLVASKGTTTPPLIISSTVLSITDSNMKDRVMADILKRAGCRISGGRSASRQL